MSVLSGNVRLRITTSVGLAVWDRKESAEDFFRRADQQLYQAKKHGPQPRLRLSQSTVRLASAQRRCVPARTD